MNLGKDGSRIWKGAKSVGLVCTQVRPQVVYLTRRKLTLVITSAGPTFHVYNAATCRLVCASDAHPSPITCLGADQKYVYTGCQNQIRAFHLNRQVKYTYIGHEAEVILVVPFGNHLISVDNQSRLMVWEIESPQTIHLDMTFDPAQFAITSLCHPDTYVNKILLGSQQGPLRLLNIRSGKTVFTFAGWGQVVSCLEPSPAVDVVAIGLENGLIKLHNLRLDETLFAFEQDWGAVTSLAFRTDDAASLLVSGSHVGHLALWDLEKQRLIGQMNSVHRGTITGIFCLPSEPVFVTTGGDNALRTWIFDRPDQNCARQLAMLEGHPSPPTLVRFLGLDGELVLSTGSNDSTLRLYSVLKSTKYWSLGTAGLISRKAAKRKGIDPLTVRLPPVTAVAANVARESAWDNIVACHSDTAIVTTWTSRKKRLGAHRLCHERFSQSVALKHAVALCCDVSACGNFALIGYSTGHVDKFNIQSGLYRGSYADGDSELAHPGPVRGIVTSILNTQIVTGSGDGSLKFWSFRNRKRLAALELLSAVSFMRSHRESGLLCCALDDFSLQIVEIGFRRIIRSFSETHSAALTAVTFDPTCKWLLSASLDCSVKVWDLPSGCLVDILTFDRPCTSLDVSATGQFLATTHSGQKGVFLWLNRLLYDPTLMLKPLSKEYAPAESTDLPGSILLYDSKSNEDWDGTGAESEQMIDSWISPAQVDNLLTLSGLPAPRWAYMLQLDVIKQRNKPTMPPTKPKSAPFFLPTVSGVDPTFDLSAKNENTQSRLVNLAELEVWSSWAKTLLKAETSPELVQAFELLKKMGPSRVDVEIRSLSPVGGGSYPLMEKFLQLLDHIMRLRTDFELTEAYLSLFLKLHSDTICESETLMRKLSGVRATRDFNWAQLDDLFESSLCMLQFLKSAVL